MIGVHSFPDDSKGVLQRSNLAQFSRRRNRSVAFSPDARSSEVCFALSTDIVGSPVRLEKNHRRPHGGDNIASGQVGGVLSPSIHDVPEDHFRQLNHKPSERAFSSSSDTMRSVCSSWVSPPHPSDDPARRCCALCGGYACPTANPPIQVAERASVFLPTAMMT
jgi:hypothetical protein